MPRLAERLRQRIERDGPISFSEFMSAALYEPGEGYYARGAAIGEPGDFATSPSLSPAFAGVAARRFCREADTFKGEIDFVEVGAGEGRFLQDLAAAISRESPGLSRRVRLTAVERSEDARRRLRSRGLALRVLESAEQLDPGSVRGCIFSNELFDSLPVDRLAGSEEGLSELRVGAEGGQFVWVRAPATAEQREQLASFGIALEPGQVGELSPAAGPLYRSLARALDRGSLITFDYGHRARVLYHPLARPAGTLAVHRGGRRGGDPLESPGESDLTAHVNWDLLQRVGEGEGLATLGVFRQGRYLSEGGLLDFVASDAEKWRAYRLIDPDGMGEELSVLIQTRGIGSSVDRSIGSSRALDDPIIR